MLPVLGAVAPQIFSTIAGMATGGGGEPKPAAGQNSDNI